MASTFLCIATTWSTTPLHSIRRQWCDMRLALLILAGVFLVTLVACKAARQEPRLQGTWRSNKDETVSVWRREGVIPAKVVARFESEVLGKMSVTYSGRRVTSTTGNDWTEVSE